MEPKFVEPGMMTGLGNHTDAVKALPDDFAGVARVLHGLFIHEFMGGMYGVTLADADRETVHLRKVADLLDAVVARDGRPLDVAREPADRIPTNCRGFSTLAVAMLRAHGVPARARCGFGMYFNPGWGEDHWVVEYHDDGRWKRGDAQIDGVQEAVFHTGLDLTDLPEGAFRTGGEAWQRVRSGQDQDISYGLSVLPESGDWWIAGNLMRDVAAVRHGVEVLPWDCWAPMPEPEDALDVEYFDRMAAGEQDVTIPDQVYSANRKRVEPLR
jgi:transglutaminase superfamily protein